MCIGTSAFWWVDRWEGGWSIVATSKISTYRVTRYKVLPVNSILPVHDGWYIYVTEMFVTVTSGVVNLYKCKTWRKNIEVVDANLFPLPVSEQVSKGRGREIIKRASAQANCRDLNTVFLEVVGPIGYAGPYGNLNRSVFRKKKLLVRSRRLAFSLQAIFYHTFWRLLTKQIIRCLGWTTDDASLTLKFCRRWSLRLLIRRCAHNTCNWKPCITPSMF